MNLSQKTAIIRVETAIFDSPCIFLISGLKNSSISIIGVTGTQELGRVKMFFFLCVMIHYKVKFLAVLTKGIRI